MGIKTFEFHHVPITLITKIRGSDSYSQKMYGHPEKTECPYGIELEVRLLLHSLKFRLLRNSSSSEQLVV